jgi:hypothetical protein
MLHRQWRVAPSGHGYGALEQSRVAHRRGVPRRECRRDDCDDLYSDPVVARKLFEQSLVDLALGRVGEVRRFVRRDGHVLGSAVMEIETNARGICAFASRASAENVTRLGLHDRPEEVEQSRFPSGRDPSGAGALGDVRTDHGVDECGAVDVGAKRSVGLSGIDH